MADATTNWVKSPAFQSDARWFKGPALLWKPVEQWPRDISDHNLIVSTSEEEIEELCLNLHHSIVQSMSRIIYIVKVSWWWRLIRRHAFVFQFINRCHDAKGRASGIDYFGPLKVTIGCCTKN